MCRAGNKLLGRTKRGGPERGARASDRGTLRGAKRLVLLAKVSGLRSETTALPESPRRSLERVPSPSSQLRFRPDAAANLVGTTDLSYRSIRNGISVYREMRELSLAVVRELPMAAADTAAASVGGGLTRRFFVHPSPFSSLNASPAVGRMRCEQTAGAVFSAAPFAHK